MSFDKQLTNTGTYYVYLDSDGVEHYFKIEDNTYELFDEDDLGYTLSIKENSIEIEDGSVIESYDIPSTGEIANIKTETDCENSNNQIEYTYNSSNMLTSIESAQHTYTFSYSTVTSDNVTVSICNNIKKDGTAFISFIYYAGFGLTSGIRYNDGKRSTFEYSNNYLVRVRQYSTSDAQDGKKLGFIYESGKVRTITEYGKNGATRNALSVQYNDDNTTKFTDINGNTETYTFDNYGNTVTVLNANGMITNGSDSGSLCISTGSDSYTKNYIDVSNEPIGISSTQYYRKGNGTIDSQTSTGGTVTVDSTNSYMGSKSIKVNHNGPSQIYTYAMHDLAVGDLAGKDVTLSAYVKTDNITEGTLSGAKGALLKMKCFDQSGLTLLDKNSVALTESLTGSKWERLSLSITVPDNTSIIRLYFGIRNAQGSAWFDCMQLETGNVMNDYNALSNSDFSTVENWIDQNGNGILLNSDNNAEISGFGGEPVVENAENTEDEESNVDSTVPTYTSIETETVNNDIVEETDSYGNVTKTMQGFVTREYRRTYEVTEATDGNNENESDENESSGSGEDIFDNVINCNSYVYQQVDVNKSNVAFNISGTAKAKSVPLNSDYRTFGIALKIKYSGDTDYSETHYQKFNAYTDVMQNVTLSVTPYESEKIVEKVAFAFVYGYNKNTMEIKNAMLNFAYDYDFSGNEYSGSDDSNTEEDSSVYAINEEIISEAVSTSQEYMQSNTVYDSSGNHITSEIDEAGNTVVYTYDNYDNITSVTDGRGNTTSYTYDVYGNILSVASENASYSNTYTSTGKISTITNVGTEYSFEYDDFDNVKKVKVGNQTLVTNYYDSLCYRLTSTSYGNGGCFTYTYDKYGRITLIGGAGHGIAKYTYNKKGLITESYDYWLQQTTHYYYDFNGNLIAKYAEGDGNTLAYNVSFDDDNSTVEQTNVNGRLMTVRNGVDSEENEYVSVDGITTKTTTDDFGRIEDVSTTYSSDNTYSPFHTEYTYVTNNYRTTNLVRKLTQSYGAQYSTEYKYTYDGNNNITNVYVNNAHIAHYVYDELNQLISASDKRTERLTEYTYDNAGNITQTKQYRLLAIDTIDENNVKGSLLKTNTYTYGDSNWGDKLTAYNGTNITYDAIGNPLSYRNGMTMEWINGRQLKKVTTSNDTVEFKYNADGLRTYKDNSEYSTYYYYDSNNNMIAMRKGGSIMYFYYDSNGNATSMSFEGMKYFYVKNQQGDVEKIINKTGEVIVKYYYDDWGNLISMTDTTSSGYGIGSFNPYRYRGYIYDDETGLYYLRSRYYDPVTGRFINADIYTDTNTGTPLSTNMFAYCENHPVSYLDSTGTIATAIAAGGFVVANSWNPVGLIVGGVCVVAIAGIAIYDYYNYSSSWETPTSISSTDTLTLSDVKVKKQNGKHYKIAYVNKTTGNLVKIGKKMNFVEALVALGISGAINDITKRYKYNKKKGSTAQKKASNNGAKNWGIYADTQLAAKALAVVFKYQKAPEVHGDGYYAHYHDKGHNFHIWYGSPINYY